MFTGKTAIDAALASGYKELAAKIAFWQCIEMRAKVVKFNSSV
jgi:hypothetical protein